MTTRREFFAAATAAIAGPTLAATAVNQPSAAMRRRMLDPTPEEIAEANHRSTCEGAVRVNIIVRDIDRMKDRINAWLDDGHGDGCQCPFCSERMFKESKSKTTQGEIFEYNLRGLFYMLESVAIIGNSLRRLDDEEIDALAAKYGLE